MCKRCIPFGLETLGEVNFKEEVLGWKVGGGGDKLYFLFLPKAFNMSAAHSVSYFMGHIIFLPAVHSSNKMVEVPKFRFLILL